jgi:hypothetical protein
MLLRENELGWRLFKSKHGFTIRRTHPPLSSRLWLVGPVFVNLLLAAALWLGRDRALWYTLSTLLPLLLWVWWAGSNKAKHIAWAALPGLVMLLGLLTKEAVSADAVLCAVPFTLLFGLLAFRPTILNLNVRHHVLGDFGLLVPFDRVNIELAPDPEGGRCQIWLEDLRPVWETPTSTGMWKCLVWESSTEAEASALVDEFRSWGVGVPDPRPPVQLVAGNRRLRLWAYAGHILSVVALIGLTFWMINGSRKGLEAPSSIVALRVAQIVIAFLFLSVLPFATYLWRLGHGAVRSRQMPPPGMRILWDTKLIEGDKAVAWGRRRALIGFTLIVVSLVGGLYAPYKLGSTYAEPLRHYTPEASTRR